MFGNSGNLLTPETPQYTPTAAQRAAGKAVAVWKERRAERVSRPMQARPAVQPTQYVAPQYVPPVEYAPPTPEFHAATQLRLIGTRDDLMSQVNQLESAGFRVAGIKLRKSRDIDNSDVILSATLIS